MTSFHCTNCHRDYPGEGVPHRCPTCGGNFGINGDLVFDENQIDTDLPGMWQYRHTFELPPDAPVLSLGEGSTPLVSAEVEDVEVFFKLEYLNPTGSFKDRISAPELSFLLSRGVGAAVEDSSGNAGASFAAYAARAGIKARVFAPSYASGPKLKQIEVYGAELVSIDGPRSNAAEAVLKDVEENDTVYASHAYLPFGLPGIATIAYELVEQLGQVPGAVIAPVGHGSLLLGIAKGFTALQQAGIIDEFPKLIGVQASACAPLWALQTMGPVGLSVVVEGETLAEGVRIRRPINGDALIQIMNENSGLFVAVDEEHILSGRQNLASLGMYVEPTSAIVWNGLQQVKHIINQLDGPTVVILTGSGLKSPV
ncbi:MAG: pyridoxal-phosphate dependent enzyme [Chloroflexota bacterium]